MAGTVVVGDGRLRSFHDLRLVGEAEGVREVVAHLQAAFPGTKVITSVEPLFALSARV